MRGAFLTFFHNYLRIGLFVACLCTMFLVSCGDDDSQDKTTSVQDQQENTQANEAYLKLLLQQWSTASAIPAFEDLVTQLTLLDNTTATFCESPTQEGLEDLQQLLWQAQQIWQVASVYNIEQVNTSVVGDLRYYTNVYPVDISDINSAISTLSYDLDTANYHDAQGFNALDYIFYGIGATRQETLALFTTDSLASNYKTYLKALTKQLLYKSNLVLTQWKAYQDTFINANDTTATGSLAIFINRYILNLEQNIRNYKVRIPAGVFSSTGETYPDKVENFYKKDGSRDLLKKALTEVKNIFNGIYYKNPEDQDAFKSVSLKGYLQQLGKEDLVQNIEQQFDNINEKVAVLDKDLATQINTDHLKLLAAHDEIQKLVVRFKVDMAQALNVIISYQDSDGD